MGLGAAVLGAGAIGAVGSLGSAAIQSSAANHAADLQQQMYQTTRGDLLPYNTAGQAATQQIQNMGAFNFAPTQAQLEATPGYQFNLSQGLKATQNGAAAQGLGSSGAALKGAASYASGLADTTYQNQFSNALNSYNTNLAKWQNLAGLGENAAAQTGNAGTMAASNAGQALIGGANATAAGIQGATGNIGNAYISNAFLNNGGLYGSGSGASGGLPANIPNATSSGYEDLLY